MASCEIHVVNPSILSKIESFLNDPAYKEAIENSANYNTRLCIERRLRMPFLDSQTGVAQNHSNLFMTTRQRIPGLREGQIYTYPSKCWRKKRRQYLSNFMQPRRKEVEIEGDLHTVSVVENLATANEDSKESVSLKDESAKDAWYYDELDMQEMEGFDEPEPDSDYDYEEPYSKRKGKKKSTKVVRTVETPAAKKPKGPGRGRKKANYDALTDAEKPFACELCGIRYKTRPGLSYHYTHSHKDRDDEESFGSEGVLSSSDRGAPSPSGSKQAASPVPSDPAVSGTAAPPGWSQFQDSYLTFLKTPGGSTRRGRQSAAAAAAQQAMSSASNSPAVSTPQGADDIPTVEEKEKRAPEVLSASMSDDKERAAPSPYCDFCLGDASENKKTGQSEELVSCSDCGRSGRAGTTTVAATSPAPRRGRGRGRGRRKQLPVVT